MERHKPVLFRPHKAVVHGNPVGGITLDEIDMKDGVELRRATCRCLPAENHAPGVLVKNILLFGDVLYIAGKTCRRIGEEGDLLHQRAGLQSVAVKSDIQQAVVILVHHAVHAIVPMLGCRVGVIPYGAKHNLKIHTGEVQCHALRVHHPLRHRKV